MPMVLIPSLILCPGPDPRLIPMPKSKSKRRFQPPPQKKPKASPRWFGIAVLGTMLAGVAVIVLNYLGLMPGFSAFGFDVAWSQTSNFYLFAGLGLIAVGFLASTQWR